MDFAKQLRKQLRFIEVSSAAYDAGYQDEAIRIAVSLRVIFHGANRSTSLLQHLEAKNVVIRSKIPDRKAQNEGLAGRSIAQFGWSLLEFSVDGFQPNVRISQRDRMVPATEWWNETVAQTEYAYTRQELVLLAANKDGGAHVDNAFPLHYEAIKQPAAIGTFENVSSGGPVPIENTHLMVLRAMASEVLASPDLLKLGAYSQSGCLVSRSPFTVLSPAAK